jgi:hypothetical protein
MRAASRSHYSSWYLFAFHQPFFRRPGSSDHTADPWEAIEQRPTSRAPECHRRTPVINAAWEWRSQTREALGDRSFIQTVEYVHTRPL